MTRYLLSVAAVVLYLLGLLSGAGWLLNQNATHAVAFIAAGLLCSALAAMQAPPPAVGPRP